MEFFWRAIYYDYTAIDQYDAGGERIVHGYEDIDRQRLQAFDIREKGTERLIHRVWLGGDKRLIWRERVYIKVIGNVQHETRIHLVGWQRTIAGKNVQSITFVFSDGHTETIDRWHENHPIFHSVTLKEEEIKK